MKSFSENIISREQVDQLVADAAAKLNTEMQNLGVVIDLIIQTQTTQTNLGTNLLKLCNLFNKQISDLKIIVTCLIIANASLVGYLFWR